MKKLIIGLLVIAVLVVGAFVVLPRLRVNLQIFEGKTTVTTRGDLEVPITASGHIRPRSVTNVKSEASGEVQKIPVKLGQMVVGDQLVIRLDPTDENRNVQKAEADRSLRRVSKTTHSALHAVRSCVETMNEKAKTPLASRENPYSYPRNSS